MFLLFVYILIITQNRSKGFSVFLHTLWFLLFFYYEIFSLFIIVYKDIYVEIFLLQEQLTDFFFLQFFISSFQ